MTTLPLGLPTWQHHRQACHEMQVITHHRLTSSEALLLLEVQNISGAKQHRLRHAHHVTHGMILL